jgi:hypothetical protein
LSATSHRNRAQLALTSRTGLILFSDQILGDV